MKTLQPYLIFPGNCKEALDFYAKCLDGEVVMLQTYAESPIDVPEEFSGGVFNSIFRAGELRFMASDNFRPDEVKPGTNVSLFIAFSDPAEQARVFADLGQDGTVLFPLDGGFGMLEDRFTMRWMLALDKEAGK